METQVGMIAHTNCYKQGFDLPRNEAVNLNMLTESFRPAKSTLTTQRLNMKSSHDEIKTMKPEAAQ